MLFYNQENFVDDTLRSLFTQEYDEYEIIIRDDFSQDNTREKIRAFLETNNPKGIIVKAEYGEENLGIIKSLNRVLSQAEGDIIVLQGGDDISEPHRIKVCEELLRKYQADLVSSDARIIDQHGKIINNSFLIRDGRNILSKSIVSHTPEEGVMLIDEVNIKALPGFCLGGYSISFRRGLLKDYGGYFPEDLPYEDRLLTFLAALNRGIAISMLPLVRYRRHTSNASMPRASGDQDIINQMLRIIHAETQVCEAQLNYLSKYNTKHDKYNLGRLRNLLFMELSKNQLIMKELGSGKYGLQGITRMDIFKAIINNPEEKNRRRFRRSRCLCYSRALPRVLATKTPSEIS